MFEALLASTFSNMRIHSWQDSQPDKQTIGHYGEALSKLRDSLTEQNAYIEDAVVFSILSLLEVEYLMGNMSAYQVHVRGLKRIVDLRGGLDSLGWVGLLKPAVTGVLAFWYSINQPWAGDPFEFDRGQYLVPLRPSVLPPDLDSAALTAYLDIGTKQLVEEGRLSPHVVSHVQQVYYNWQDVDLYTFSPFGGKSAANVEGRERGWSLMAYAGNSLVDRIVLTAMQHTLLDVSHAERFSEYYGRLIFNWVGFCSSAIDEVDEGDTALCDLLIWLCMKLVGGLTATFLRVQSSSKDDQRFQLMTKVLAIYPKTQDWKTLESIVKKFKWSEHCLHFWHLSWQIVTSSSLTEPELRAGAAIRGMNPS
ncbi:hypothetical protein LTR67_009277 [Exophiala xenobiotica]